MRAVRTGPLARPFAGHAHPPSRRRILRTSISEWTDRR
ncbi:hypothetical protein BURPS305_6688 [Burkholderia pseudomallei 305]|nr:hypothetical protein BURPS305_6688 [Burkholderia pseudomallei 305]